MTYLLRTTLIITTTLMTFTAIAKREPGAYLNHDFKAIYKEGFMAQTAKDTVLSTTLEADLDHRLRHKTKKRAYRGVRSLVVGDDTPYNSPLGDTLK